MKPLSIEDALQWTQRFVLREWRLLLPVALAFLALPQLTLGLLLPASTQAALTQMAQGSAAPLLHDAPWLVPAALVIQALAFLGVLALVGLALVPRISVREAMLLALRRLPVLIAAIMLIIVAELVVATLLAILLSLLRVDATVQEASLLGIILGASLLVSVRLMMLTPVVAASRAGPIAAIRLAWELTQGAFWRLFAAILVYAVGGLVVVFASAFALGAVLLLATGAIGNAGLGNLFSTVYLRFALAIFWTGLHVLVAALYRQLGGTIRGI